MREPPTLDGRLLGDKKMGIKKIEEIFDGLLWCSGCDANVFAICEYCEEELDIGKADIWCDDDCNHFCSSKCVAEHKAADVKLSIPHIPTGQQEMFEKKIEMIMNKSASK